MGTMGTKVTLYASDRRLILDSQDVTVAPYDPFSQGEQVYLGSMDLELSFTKPNFKTDVQFDADELAKFFVSVLLFSCCSPLLTYNRCFSPKYSPPNRNLQWTIDLSK
jgi:hypothetical protein